MKTDYPDQKPHGAGKKSSAPKLGSGKSLSGKSGGGLHLKAHKPSKAKMKY